MALGLVMRPGTMQKDRVPLVLQELATRQSVRIVPHLEATQGIFQNVRFEARVQNLL